MICMVGETMLPRTAIFTKIRQKSEDEIKMTLLTKKDAILLRTKFECNNTML